MARMEQISKRRQQVSGWLVIATGVVALIAITVFDVDLALLLGG